MSVRLSCFSEVNPEVCPKAKSPTPEPKSELLEVAILVLLLQDVLQQRRFASGEEGPERPGSGFRMV